MTDLSPAARAVWEAFNSKFDWMEDGVPGPQFHSIAAALRAAANAVTPEPLDSKPGASPALKAVHWERKTTRQQLLAIAAELEGAGAE